MRIKLIFGTGLKAVLVAGVVSMIEIFAIIIKIDILIEEYIE